MARSDEIRAGGAIAGDVLANGVGVVRDVHRAVARRVFGSLGRPAAPVRIVHDAIAGTVYGTVRAAHAVAPRAGSAAASLAVSPDAPPIAARPFGRLALGALNGLWGDHLARGYPSLALPLSLRAEGSDLALTPEGMARAYPRPTSSLVLFVHGLCESEESWSLAAERRYGDRSVTYGSLLRDDLGFTPFYLRYNTGLHVSDNARGLAHLLEELVEVWPVPIGEIVLIGHSMGGVVIRGACHYAAEANYQWVGAVRHVFCLGTPHLGAPLERGVNALAYAMYRVPETRPAARLLNARSAGVKDLRYGACVQADWHGHDPDEYLRDRCTEVPFIPHAAYYFIAATLARDPASPAARYIGDLLVQLPSAAGDGPRRRLPFPVDNGAHFGGLHHFDLLNHPDVYAQLKTWIAGAPTASPRPASPEPSRPTHPPTRTWRPRSPKASQPATAPHRDSGTATARLDTSRRLNPNLRDGTG
jgi:PGAP1-like protein